MSAQSIDRSATGATVWRLPWNLLAVAAVAGLLSVLPFWNGLTQMWQFWVDYPEYSHCLLIPPVAVFLIWQQKDRLERVAFSGSWWGVALLLLGGALLVVGQLATIYTLVQYAYLITLYGLTLSFLGWAAFRLIAVPLLILWFMIPLPSFLLFNLSAELQLISSQLGVDVIRLFGISVFLEGNVIDLGGYKLQVAEACSGLRYLFPLMTLGFLMAYFYKGARWKRIVLFLSSVPITLIMNSLRIGIIGVTVEHWGIDMAEGFLHEFQGWMIFMLSTLLMLGEIAVLNRVGHERGTLRQLFGVEFPAPTPRGAPMRQRKLPASFIAASALLVVFILSTIAIARPAEIFPSRTSFVEFPVKMGEWLGHRDALEAVFTDQLKLDDYLLANYADDSANLVNLYIAYYNSQRKGEAVHSPRSCLPGGGWQMRDFGQRTVAGVLVNGRPLRVNRTLIELGNQRQLVYYWFQQRGRIITNEFAVKWYLFWDALTLHRTDGAMVRLITPLPASGSEPAADRRLADLAAQAERELPRFVPN
ncbi:MAG TPA: VPLPA-CTERM-specific exosortase XrtD [Steroidobacteraceae bacterium]|jgi:exosortase D (VPLPA-CTERM-specific)